MLGHSSISSVPISTIGGLDGGGNPTSNTLTLSQDVVIVRCNNYYDTLGLSQQIAIDKEVERPLDNTLVFEQVLTIFNLGQVDFYNTLSLTQQVNIHPVPLVLAENDLDLTQELVIDKFARQDLVDNLTLSQELQMKRYREIYIDVCNSLKLDQSIRRTHEESVANTITLSDGVNDDEKLEQTIILAQVLETNAIFSLCSGVGYVPDKLVNQDIIFTQSVGVNINRGVPVSNTLTISQSALIYKG